MVRISPQCWLKTSVEYEPEESNRLGAVVTNQGYSDWSTQDFPDECHEIMLRVRRERSDYLVEYSLPLQSPEESEHWTQIRMAHLHDDNGEMAVQCGIYACSPKENGYVAEFAFLKIEKK
jgi:regulation of enolase protein 1 (concanavalin A-like superfamily)